eukprot:m.189878 g.189878  ORF g.189878 m.189878 type:complete len:271 (-) comp18218_c0_seq6:31-843(-)
MAATDGCEDETATVEPPLPSAEDLQRVTEEDPMPAYKRDRLRKFSQRNWDMFYKRNTTHFFKDRHWLDREFPEMTEPGRRTLLETGCGVGNAAFPLAESHPDMFVYACDFSQKAVDLVKANELYDAERMSAFQCDLTAEACFEGKVEAGSVDFVTMLFVLSAIETDCMLAAMRNVCSALKPGGRVFFRDYGENDHAMLRFKRGHKLADKLYVRQDGTRAFYFSLDPTASLFADAGFDVEKITYVVRETVNRKEGLAVPRIFLQATLRKKP